MKSWSAPDYSLLDPSRSGTSALKPTPFLKWAGGKRWLIPHITDYLPYFKGHYIEPFLGSGAVFFSLMPRSAVLNDLNRDLIDTYQAIKLDHTKVHKHLIRHHERHTKDYYYNIRTYNPKCYYEKAAKFIYLNRTCWNGLYRVNRNGIFNVPIGTKTNVCLPTDNWGQTAALLQNATFTCGDFEFQINSAKEGDLIFADPPYTIKHNLNGFIKYNEALFSWSDQERLAAALIRAKDRGAIIISTNANHESVRELYVNHFNLSILERNSVLSGIAQFRGKFQELLIATF